MCFCLVLLNLYFFYTIYKCNTFILLLNLAFIHREEFAIHLFHHNFIPPNLEVMVIKEFNVYELMAKLPPLPRLVRCKRGSCPCSFGTPVQQLLLFLNSHSFPNSTNVSIRILLPRKVRQMFFACLQFECNICISLFYFLFA